MSAQRQMTAKGSTAAPVASLPERSGLVQRKCACGGTPGPTGECTACRRERLLGGTLQTKLRIGQPGDRFEQEADRVADTVLRMPEPAPMETAERKEKENPHTKPLASQITTLVQRVADETTKAEEEEERGPETPPLPKEEETVQPKLENTDRLQREKEEKEQEEEEEPSLAQAKGTDDQPLAIPKSAASRIQSLRDGGGQPLPASERTFYEPRFGYDFGNVRIHTDRRAQDTAKSIKAHAYTVGRDIVFGAGQHSHSTPFGRRLIAHELTHVVQQAGEGRAPDRLLTKRSRTHIARKPNAVAKKNPVPDPKKALKKLLETSGSSGLLNFPLSGKEVQKVFSILRKHHASFKGDQVLEGMLKERLEGDDLWYGLALFYYGQESSWPLPARLLPTKLPFSKKKLFDILKRLKKEERTDRLRIFLERVFSGAREDYWHARWLFHLGKSGETGWVRLQIKRILRLYEKTKHSSKTKLFDLLREYHKAVKRDGKSDQLLRKGLKGDDLWYGLGILHFGPEKSWPLPKGFKPPATPNTKGAFFQMLREVFLKKKTPAAKTSPRLGRFIHRVFSHGDRIYAANLYRYGTEPNWPAEVVKKLASKKEVQPSIPQKSATGYKGFKGVEYIKGIHYSDIKQGYLGDCFLLAALAAIAKLKPSLIDKMVQINKNGTYTVYFYDTKSGNVKHTEYLLPGFPVKGKTRPYGKSKEKAELWVSIVEKAYAAWHGKEGGYRKIGKGGSAYTVFRKLTGNADHHTIGTSKHFMKKKKKGKTYYVADTSKPSWKLKMSQANVKGKIKKAINDGRPITASTYTPPWRDYRWKKIKNKNEKKKILGRWKKALGYYYKKHKIHPWHTYAVLDIKGSTVKLYNPHGNEVNINILYFTYIFSSISIGQRLKKP